VRRYANPEVRERIMRLHRQLRSSARDVLRRYFSAPLSAGCP